MLERELEVAVAAVRAASRVCREVQASLVTADTLEKKDKSPVTVADFASQAVVCRALAEHFQDDPVVGEEGADDLRGDDAEVLRRSVVQAVGRSVGQETDDAAVLGWIDRGGFDPAGASPDRRERYWTLDPIDGTKGFLRGEQYAVALALIVQGRVALGVLGCPNLDDGRGGVGALFSAVRGQGAQALPVEGEGVVGTPITVDSADSPSGGRFCESVESAHSDQGDAARIAAKLGITAKPYRIDSQCKYAAVGRGDASIYLRLPTRKDYEEKIWDHGAGSWSSKRPAAP